jgi:hypothetical protein
MSASGPADETNLESIRARFLPDGGVRVLLVGESPPPGRGFFYSADSTLFRETHKVFMDRCGYSEDEVTFLRQFADGGFFLVDLSSVRGDKPHLRQSAPDVLSSLSAVATLIGVRTIAVVGVLLDIDDLVHAAVKASPKASVRIHSLPFPFHRSEQLQARYRSGLDRILQDVGCR